MRQVRVANCSADAQTAIARLFNLVEWQAIDIHQARGSLNVQLHQIDERGAAAQETHIGALLRRFRLRGGCDRPRLICWTNELESMHRETPALSAIADLLDRRDDVGIGAA